jgi:hypothetical protein
VLAARCSVRLSMAAPSTGRASSFLGASPYARCAATEISPLARLRATLSCVLIDGLLVAVVVLIGGSREEVVARSSERIGRTRALVLVGGGLVVCGVATMVI